MRHVVWKNHKSFVRNIIFLILGVFLGFFFCITNYGVQIDSLIDKNEKLTLEIKNYQIENNSLKNEIEQRKQNKLIRSIKFHINEKLDSFSETELLEKLIDETYFLIGKEIEDIIKSPDFIYQLLNQRVYEVEDKSFEIRVKFIYIQSTTEIWISVDEQ